MDALNVDSSFSITFQDNYAVRWNHLAFMPRKTLIGLFDVDLLPHRYFLSA